MDGVTILNTINSNKDVILGIVLLILGLFVLCITILSAICSYEEIGKFNILTAFSIFCAIITFVFIIIGIINLVNLDATTYEVTISDEVSFKDFTSKYEIIEQRGEIYIVKERQTNNKENQNQ